MATEYLKKAPRTPATGEDDTRRIVSEMLAEIQNGGEERAREYGVKLDGYSGDVLVSRETIEAASRQVPERLKDDLKFAHEKVAEFARRQRDSVQEFETELSPGVWAGQRLIPIETAGCYVPGGRYAHVASAIMGITTARVAGVANKTRQDKNRDRMRVTLSSQSKTPSKKRDAAFPPRTYTPLRIFPFAASKCWRASRGK